jgi:flagellar biosynthesis/type III secretory pathway ATPase
MSRPLLDAYLDRVADLDPLPIAGRVVRTVGLVVESLGPRARVGDICELSRGEGEAPLALEVVGFRDGHLLTIPLGPTSGIQPGDRLVVKTSLSSAPVGIELLGRVLDGLGRPIDNLGPIHTLASAPGLPLRGRPR